MVNMFIQVRKCLLNHSTTARKNVTRKYTLPAVTKLDTAEDAMYPPILDLSPRAVMKREKEKWHNKIKKLETVEEKLYGINMPRYYGWKSLDLKEGDIPYDSLPQARYITRTHVVNDHKLPDFYNNLITPEELDTKIQSVKKQIEDVIIFEYCSRMREEGVTGETENNEALRNDITNAVTYQINRILLTSLSSTVPHLMEAEVDFEPRVEAFWFAGGIDPPHILKQSKEAREFTKEYANDPVDMPVQYVGSPILQLRHRVPLKEIIPKHESENPELSIPVYKFDPRVLGYKFEYKHATSIPGFWPGDPSEFGLLSYHNANHLLQRPKNYKDESQALTVQAIFASYSWLLSQACYQGFSTVNDMTYPLVSQTVITNGQWWTFCAYQLNTTLLHSEYADENPVRNMCWITEPMKLFDTVENEKIHGFNEDVLKSLMKFYINMPEERTGVNMKPYLGESVKRIADIPDVQRRTWLEEHFKNLVSNRPRHFKIPEVYLWQKFYMIDHKTRPMDKKRDPWQYGYRPMKRRLDDHLPIYIPRCLRENPKKRKIGRWAKTYYPDA